MKSVGKRNSKRRRLLRARGVRLWLSCVVSSALLFGGCFKEPQGERFYGKVSMPTAQEFRWSDGGLPKIFDPARAAAPPDTDVVRALYEGLTEYETGTLRAAPAVASRWEVADGGRRWTFYLRDGARWTNGDPVTAQDFVRSWQRTLHLGDRAPHAALLSNIEGAESLTTRLVEAEQEGATGVDERGAVERPREGERGKGASAKPTPRPPAFGVVALDSKTLRVTLKRPDMNFPALVAHPVFRPVHELSPEAVLPELLEEQKQGIVVEPGIVTNGAFSLARLAGDSVELARAESYWDAASVQLERVRFVDTKDTESALAAYRAGDVDVVSNTAVEPLAVKLLTPYEDFRRETFAALNYYRFNTARPPFDDVRVRQALAYALDVARLSKDTLGGATEPTRTFIPAPAAEAPREGDEAGTMGLDQNVERARKLLEQAGYPGGVNFPRVRLLVNRNEQQRLVAQAVARMWRDALGVETEVVIKPWEEYEAMLRAGDYDVVRRSLVMQTTDEETNMRQLFGEVAEAQIPTPESETAPPEAPANTPPVAEGGAEAAHAQVRPTPAALSESQALRELPAIPLHFASSYALVKPYVDGFESNLLDAPSLKHVRINHDWRPPAPEQAARLAPASRR